MMGGWVGKENMKHISWTEPKNTGIDWDYQGITPDGRKLHQQNSMPRPFTPLTQEKFNKLMWCQPYQHSAEGNYRQVLEDIGSKLAGRWSVSFVHCNRYTLAVATKFGKYRKETLEDSGEELTYMVWKHDLWGMERYTHYMGYAIRFYRIGCNHPGIREVSDPNRHDRFDHTYKCPECGYTYTVNSSD